MEKDIGKIPKNPDTDIVIRVDDFGGRVGVTIREFANSETYKGFTKSGTKISAENFDKFKEMINSINPDDFKTSNEQASLPNQNQSQQKSDEEMDAGVDADGLM